MSRLKADAMQEPSDPGLICIGVFLDLGEHL